MKLQRFFVNEKIEAESTFVLNNQEQIDQIKKVFRKKIGEIIGLLDNSGTGYTAEIKDFEKK